MLRSHLIPLACVAMLGLTNAAAQTGTIQGNVADAVSATVPNAKVTAFDQDKKVVVRTTTTNREGAFVLTPLLPGIYNIKVEAQGFKTYESNSLKLDQNQVMNLGSIALQLGQLSESVSVEAQIPLVET